MEFIIQHWYTILVILVFIVGGTTAVVRFTKLTKAQRIDQIKGWLLQAVILAEAEFGSGTGRLKLSAVYDKFCARFPWLAKIISFEAFSGYVDKVLIEMRELLAQNTAIAAVVDKHVEVIQND